MMDVQFQPVVGETMLLAAVQPKGSQLPDSGRVNIGIPDLANMLWTVALEGELAASVATGTTLQANAKIVVGERVRTVRGKLTGKDVPKNASGYQALAGAAYSALRWIPQDIETPRASFPEWGLTQQTTQAGLRLIGAAPFVVVGVIGVAAAAAAALAYWAGKREDRIASVETGKLRTLAVTNAIVTLAANQLAQGKELPPQMMDALLAIAGGKTELGRDWSVPVVAGVSGLALLGGIATGVYVSKKAS